MTTYIAILRGINVSGTKIIKMDALKQLMVELGFLNIETYIQSGNIVFESKKSKSENLELKISDAIAKKFDFVVPTIVKELDDLKKIIDKNPFANDKSKDPQWLHVTFLSAASKQVDVQKISHEQYLPDEFIVFDTAVYLYCPNGYGNTKLTNGFFEKKLKVNATTRNWRTTNHLKSIAEKIANNV